MNTEDATLIPGPTPLPPPPDAPFPTTPDPAFYLTPQAGLTVREGIEIQLACVLRMMGAQISQKGGLSSIQLPQSFVDMLSDGAARHFTKAPE